MTINSTQLREHLEQQYELVCFIDLAEITETPGKIYSVLEKYFKPEFRQNQRLVFYTSYNISEDLLIHINEACLHVDISASFILLCSKYDHSTVIEKIFRSDDCPTTLSVDVNSMPLSDKYRYPETICPLPWMHLVTMYQGQIHPCCVNSDIIGNVKDHTLEEIFTGDRMQQLRQELLEGKKPQSCNHCWKIESHAGLSTRQILLKKYKTKFLDEWLFDMKIRSLDLKAGNTCNFKCRICNPTASSMIASEELTHAKDQKEILWLKDIVKQGKWFDDVDVDMLNKIITLAPNLMSIDFYGGEPFLSKSLNHLLDKLIQSGYADQISIHVNSNGSIFPDHLIENLSKFKSTNICLSIDDIGPRFEYQRGGQWQDIETNLKKYKSLESTKFELSIYPVVNIQNVYYLDELINWADDNQLTLIADYLTFPNWLSLSSLTAEAKQIIINKFQHHSHPLIQSVLSRIKMSGESSGQKFCNEMNKLDLRRGQKFSDHHCEIAKAMGLND